MREGGPTSFIEDGQNQWEGPVGIRRGFVGGAAKLFPEGGPEVGVVLLEVPPLSGSLNATASGGLGVNL